MPFTQDNKNAIPLIPVNPGTLDAFIGKLDKPASNWVHQSGFQAKSGEHCLISDSEGMLSKVLVGIDEGAERRWAIAGLPDKLPVGSYQLDCDWDDADIAQAMIGWGLGCYRFDQFTESEASNEQPTLFLPETHKDRVNTFCQALNQVRDLVNLPANYMMPEHVSETMQGLAKEHGASFNEIVGDDLLKENHPTIHAVGRASDHDPRLLSLNWGNSRDPKLFLVGKGVCFDTGGLNLKPSRSMRTMKKDMGGAAHVIGLARLVMALKLPVSLTVLVPAVDNAVSGDAFRPGDILVTRSGKSVEIDNTDAEGRLVLCDALSLACESDPDLIIDFATLTGAARVALGTEVPVVFSNDHELASSIQQQSMDSEELMWPLPLHKPYLAQLKSHVADIANSSGGGYGGAITAALYLAEFVDDSVPWAHIDLMSYNTRSRPGRPIGGEAMGLFSMFDFLEKRYR